jgi:ribosomal protein S27AE
MGRPLSLTGASFHDSRATCGRCGAVHAVFRWLVDRSGAPHAPVREPCTYRCRKCGAVLFEEDERDGDHTMVLLDDDPEAAAIRGRNKRVVRDLARDARRDVSAASMAALGLCIVGAALALSGAMPWTGAGLLAAAAALAIAGDGRSR